MGKCKKCDGAGLVAAEAGGVYFCGCKMGREKMAVNEERLKAASKHQMSEAEAADVVERFRAIGGQDVEARASRFGDWHVIGQRRGFRHVFFTEARFRLLEKRLLATKEAE